MARGVRWIRRSEELRALVEELGDRPVALDTESDSFHHYPQRLCLVQLSVAGEDLLIDPLADVDLRVLERCLADDRVRKYLHGADYDLRVLDRESGLRVRGLFDTMIAARLTGERSYGLASLLERNFSVRLDKRYQLADWSRRPLPPAMETYAAMDTRYLEQLGAALERRLAELGRLEWAAEEFRRLEEVRWSEDPTREEFRRVKGSGGLDRRGLGVLRELVDERERLAREQRRPPFRIAGDATLVAVAQARPRTAAELARAARSGRDSDDTRRRWLSAVRRGMELPAAQLPERLRGKRRALEPTTRRRLRELKRKRDAIARELDLDPTLLASRAALERIVERIDSGEEPLGDDELRGWQRRLLARAMDGSAPG